MTTVLEGRRIIVTGAATGIGAAAVDVLTAAGAKVVATYHNTKPQDETSASWVHCDVTDQESVEAAFGQAVETLGGLDVLMICTQMHLIFCSRIENKRFIGIKSVGRMMRFAYPVLYVRFIKMSLPVFEGPVSPF